MKTEESLGWIKDQLCRADSAERLLLSAKRQKVSEYDERLRKIRSFTDSLFVKRTDAQQLELFQPQDILTSDLEKLLAAPLRGLE